jgi:cation diffusion facilitator CzcD-associated flavoprotein CzcO
MIPVSEEQRLEFEANPDAYYKFRKIIEQDGNTVHGVTLAGSDLQKGAVEAFRAMMKQRLAKKPEIVEFLTPSFAVGCRRLTPGPGYLEALVEDNVDFVSTKIRSIMPKGVELENGRIVELDVLICATGFNASGPPPFVVTGKNGANLEERYTPYPKTYLSIAVDGFPNYFMMLGPNAVVGSGSLTMILEMEGDYITKCIRKLQKEDYVTMTPKRERVKDFSQYIDEYFKKTVWSPRHAHEHE